MPRPFHVYLLRCSDESFYVGHTDDLERRVREHVEGGRCVYTTSRRPVRLVWSQEYVTREEAKAAEVRIKRWSRLKKESLDRGNTEGLRMAARKDWAKYRARKRGPEHPE